MTRRAPDIRPGLIPRLISDQRGVSAVEFALLAPLMILIYFGLTEFSQAYMAERRVGHTAAMVADLVAQSGKTSTADLESVAAIGQMLMKPFPAAPLTTRISSVTVDAQGRAWVDWSYSSNAKTLKPLSKAEPITDLPSGLASDKESLIIGETRYEYKSAFKDVIPTLTTFGRKYYLRPRTVNQVICSDC
ncbi:TadE/TadG family type IV pilus assembly protein [Brevundimonas sp. NPDC090276]|uniref:TadE/TadG family type IV pilus assembly protein n=1 Tax=Brevundimonas sp. NPDC090276 TaxID=3363956 RepID=UPI003839D83F